MEQCKSIWYNDKYTEGRSEKVNKTFKKLKCLSMKISAVFKKYIIVWYNKSFYCQIDLSAIKLCQWRFM